jgi:8-oxo-dGTP pyrophosphatase MutT (NUDIX family)
MQDMDRHLTVSGFVVHEGRVALHWHRKLQMWLPAGGHIEPGEDPLEATLREISEEFGIEAEALPLAPRVEYAGGPRQIEPPYTILNCIVSDDHEHVDHVYFCRAVKGYPGVPEDPETPIFWFDAEELALGEAPLNGANVPFPPDVQALGIEAIRLASRVEAAAAGPR